ncbi:hypothetical protein AAFF_G00291620 [Aldrovandia affinis]|uniref:Uncharacterized protein n=1 Tax=Aldrovandia affinis TaxID=143900 RepID=A0AAD7WRM3_9TELE|nr:hypothetical protein AAFF_G00291620 [Aldrovandia affinis]
MNLSKPTISPIPPPAHLILRQHFHRAAVRTCSVNQRIPTQNTISKPKDTDRGATERACKDPNPIIDGRKANVNLAYLGAKPRSLQTVSCQLLSKGERESLPERSKEIRERLRGKGLPADTPGPKMHLDEFYPRCTWLCLLGLLTLRAGQRPCYNDSAAREGRLILAVFLSGGFAARTALPVVTGK